MDIHEMTASLNDISLGYQRSQILLSAVEANVFAHLESPTSADVVAHALGWDARGTRMLLDGLVGLGLIEKTAGEYRNGAMAAACLVPGKPHYQGNILRHQKSAYAPWGRLSEAVQSGKAVPCESTQRSEQDLRNFILGMADIAHISALDMLDVLNLSSHTHLLDLGGGPGSYAITFAQKYPALRATVFDRPEVLPIAREQVENAALIERIDFRGGDFLGDDLGSGYDLVLVSNIIHMLGPDRNQRLMQRCFDAMRSGGLLIVKDFFPNSERTAPPYALYFALHMLVNTGEGDTYTRDEVEVWTRTAGFVNGETRQLTPKSDLWLARKP